MDLNTFIFPRPQCNWRPEDLPGRLIFVPKIINSKLRRQQRDNSIGGAPTSMIGQPDIPVFKTRESVMASKQPVRYEINENMIDLNQSVNEFSTEEKREFEKISNYNFSVLLKSKEGSQSLQNANFDIYFSRAVNNNNRKYMGRPMSINANNGPSLNDFNSPGGSNLNLYEEFISSDKKIKTIYNYDFGDNNLALQDNEQLRRRVRMSKSPKTMTLNLKQKYNKEENMGYYSESEGVEVSQPYCMEVQRNDLKIAKTVRPTLMPSSSQFQNKNMIPASKSIGITRSDQIQANLTVFDASRLQSIPCLFLRSIEPSDTILIYFHANAEDIKQAQQLCNYLKDSLNVRYM